MSFREIAGDFCTNQARSVKFLEQSAQEESFPNESPTTYSKLPFDVSIFVNRLNQLLLEVSSQKPDSKLRVCEVLNRVVLNSEDIYGAVRRISEKVKKQEEHLSQLEQVFAMVVENFGRGIFEMARAANGPGNSLAAIEKYEAGLAMVKFTQMVNPLGREIQELKHCDPWDVPLNSACDVRITTTKAGREPPKVLPKAFKKADLSTPLGRFQRLREAPVLKTSPNQAGPLTDLRCLEKALIVQLHEVQRFCKILLRFAQWWFDFLGGHELDYGYKRYIEKCHWQAKSSQTFLQQLSRLRDKVASMIHVCTKTLIKRSDLADFLQIATAQLVMASVDWYKFMAIGSSGSLWSEIEREYGRAVLATERCLALGDTDFKL